MAEYLHLDSQPACPFLPTAEHPLRATEMRKFGKERGPEFYLGALQVAQSLWLQALPAQALLQINRAFGSDLSDEDRELKEFELPYRAVAWVMAHRTEDQFIGNPRRHFQHLATRMVEPRKNQRRWRAWACWYLACEIFPDYPADEVQLVEEKVKEPTREEIIAQLTRYGLSNEARVWERAATHPFPEDWKGDRCKQ